MARSDFAWVNFDEQFNTSNPEATRTFEIDDIPIGTGYLLIQHFDVEIGNHRIIINGQDLPSFDIPAIPQNRITNDIWLTWMDRVPPGFLRQGDNRITIRRVTSQGTEAFRIANVAVHWRESD